MAAKRQKSEKMSVRRGAEVVSLILIVFLSVYFAFSIGLDNFGMLSVMSALCTTYIFVYHWQKRESKKREARERKIHTKKEVK